MKKKKREKNLMKKKRGKNKHIEKGGETPTYRKK